MPASPATTEQLQDVQKEVLDLKLKFEEAMRQEAEFRRQIERLYDLKEQARSARGTVPGVPAWIAPLLQGLTLVIVIGAALWVGQVTGTTSTRIDNLQKSVDKLNGSVDKLNDWKETASVSLASLNQKVDDLNSKVDDLKSRVDDISKAKK